MAKKDFWEFTEDFHGTGVVTATQAHNPLWRLAITGAGPPTGALVTPSSSGEFTLDMSSDTQIQNICLYQSDILQFDIDKIHEEHFRVKMNQATLDVVDKSQFSFGLGVARNDTFVSIQERVAFTIDSVNSSNTVVDISTDDNSADSGLVTTGVALINVYKDFLISFTEGTDDVRFFIDGVPVATATTFDMSGYASSLQLFFQLQKESDNGTDGATIDRVSINGVR